METKANEWRHVFKVRRAVQRRVDGVDRRRARQRCIRRGSNPTSKSSSSQQSTAFQSSKTNHQYQHSKPPLYPKLQLSQNPPPQSTMGLTITKLALAVVLLTGATSTLAAPGLDTRTLTKANEYRTSDWHVPLPSLLLPPPSLLASLQPLPTANTPLPTSTAPAK